jgi:hypothetical protein
VEGTDKMVKFLLGLVLGLVLAIGYYDGFVAREYKDRLKLAAGALVDANDEIIKRDEQIHLLLLVIEELKKRQRLDLFADK